MARRLGIELLEQPEQARELALIRVLPGPLAEGEAAAAGDGLASVDAEVAIVEHVGAVGAGLAEGGGREVAELGEAVGVERLFLRRRQFLAESR